MYVVIINFEQAVQYINLLFVFDEEVNECIQIWKNFDHIYLLTNRLK